VGRVGKEGEASGKYPTQNLSDQGYTGYYNGGNKLSSAGKFLFYTMVMAMTFVVMVMVMIMVVIFLTVGIFLFG
jgi:uncharacterized membrane protein